MSRDLAVSQLIKRIIDLINEDFTDELDEVDVIGVLELVKMTYHREICGVMNDVEDDDDK